MEEPSSPISPMLRHMQNAFAHTGASASPGAYLPDADACLQPNDSETLLNPYGLPRPRFHGGFIPSASSFQQTCIGNNESLKENEDEVKMDTACATTKNDTPSLRVDCHLYYDPSVNWGTQPITPSPQATSKTLDDDSSGGWRVPNVGLQRRSCANEDGKRIGYDGTTQTPSIQLLKPTASSLGHRVHKINTRSHQVMPLPPDELSSTSTYMNSPTIDFKPRNAAADNMPAFMDHGRVMGGCMETMAFDTPLTTFTIDPFGKLKSVHSNNGGASDEDGSMSSMMQNSSHLLDDFDADAEATDNGGMNDDHQGLSGNAPPKPMSRFNQPPPSPLHRSISWSPGPQIMQQGSYSGRSCPESLRSLIIDPVASQLLRACTVNDEDQEGQHVPLSMSSHAIGSISEAGGDAMMCRSPEPLSNNSNFAFSTSMPDLRSPIPPNKMDKGGGKGGSKHTPMIMEEADSDYPLSPVPLSDSLVDVNTGDDIKFLARPVPRKGMPTIMDSPTRRSSLPRNYRHRFGSL